MTITEELQAVLDVVSAAKCLTFMGHDPSGFPIVGPVGWVNLQEALASLVRTHGEHDDHSN